MTNKIKSDISEKQLFFGIGTAGPQISSGKQTLRLSIKGEF